MESNTAVPGSKAKPGSSSSLTCTPKPCCLEGPPLKNPHSVFAPSKSALQRLQSSKRINMGNLFPANNYPRKGSKERHTSNFFPKKKEPHKRHIHFEVTFLGDPQKWRSLWFALKTTRENTCPLGLSVFCGARFPPPPLMFFCFFCLCFLLLLLLFWGGTNTTTILKGPRKRDRPISGAPGSGLSFSSGSRSKVVTTSLGSRRPAAFGRVQTWYLGYGPHGTCPLLGGSTPKKKWGKKNVPLMEPYLNFEPEAC